MNEIKILYSNIKNVLVNAPGFHKCHFFKRYLKKITMKTK